jgi:translation initiation factor 2 beta subunit (eIF-2beta)/eIF-5
MLANTKSLEEFLDEYLRILRICRICKSKMVTKLGEDSKDNMCKECKRDSNLNKIL